MFSGRCISITVIQRIGQQTKKYNMKKTLILFNFLLFTSCIQQATADYSKDFIVPDIKINGDEKFINFDSDYIFDQKSLHTFELKIPGKDNSSKDILGSVIDRRQFIRYGLCAKDEHNTITRS